MWRDMCKINILECSKTGVYPKNPNERFQNSILFSISFAAHQNIWSSYILKQHVAETLEYFSCAGWMLEMEKRLI